MSKKKSWAIGVIVGVMVVLIGFFFGYLFGLSQCKPCPEVKKVVVKKPIAAKKSPKKVAQALTPVPAPVLAPTPAPAPALALIPALVPAPQKLILRLNVVEWSQIFEGRSLMSRDIGTLIRKGLADGTVKRATQPLMFNVNGAMVTVQGGQVTLDPGKIGPETAVVVQPSGNVEFASPPGKLPLVTEPGELDSLVKKGARELWLNFILAPR